MALIKGHTNKVVLVLVGLSLALLFHGAVAFASDIPVGQIRRGVKLKLGISEDSFDVLTTKYRGQDIVLIILYANEETLQSSLDPEIKAELKKHLDKNAFMISAISNTPQTKFHPHSLRVEQDGNSWAAASSHGITDDFNRGSMPEKMKVMGKTFWGSKGVVVMPDQFTPKQGFNIRYGTSAVSFPPQVQVAETTTGTSAEQSNKPQKQSTGTETFSPDTRRTGGYQSRSSSMLSGGFALVSGFLNLLLITMAVL